MDVDSYLARIGYAGSLGTKPQVLRDLHRAHMHSVPFENIDIHLGQRIELGLESIYDKIVRRRRGGFCYELNGLFAWLLERLGFAVRRHSGRVFGAAGLGPEFDHLTLQVSAGEAWLVDVGFGDSFVEPLPLVPSNAVEQAGCGYRLQLTDEIWCLERRKQGEDWEPQYQFTLVQRRLEEFAAMCDFHQTDASSPFTQKRVCSLATPVGRITLSGRRLILTDGDRREESELADEEAIRKVLRQRFGIDLGDVTGAQSRGAFV